MDYALKSPHEDLPYGTAVDPEDRDSQQAWEKAVKAASVSQGTKADEVLGARGLTLHAFKRDNSLTWIFNKFLNMPEFKATS